MANVTNKIWKIIVIIAIVLLVLGIVTAAFGYFTGGSVNRMVEVRFGGWESFGEFIDMLRTGFFNFFNFLR